MRLLYFLFLIVAGISCRSQVDVDDIILINVGSEDRGIIADQISIINSLKPKVLALDILFVNNTEYPKDRKLFVELTKCKRLVMASMIGDFDENVFEYNMFVNESEAQFLTNARTGFVNNVSEEMETNTVRRFSIVKSVKGEKEFHFSVRTAMEFDSLRTMNFVSKHPEIVNIDYKNGNRVFKVYLSSDLFNKKLTLKDIEGKIVIMGYLGPSIEDRFRNPIRRKAKVEPEIYGLEILANIVAQVLGQ